MAIVSPTDFITVVSSLPWLRELLEVEAGHLVVTT
jgi:hypothetical protein